MLAFLSLPLFLIWWQKSKKAMPRIFFNFSIYKSLCDLVEEPGVGLVLVLAKFFLQTSFTTFSFFSNCHSSRSHPLQRGSVWVFQKTTRSCFPNWLVHPTYQCQVQPLMLGAALKPDIKIHQTRDFGKALKDGPRLHVDGTFLELRYYDRDSQYLQIQVHPRDVKDF